MHWIRIGRWKLLCPETGARFRVVKNSYWREQPTYDLEYTYPNGRGEGVLRRRPLAEVEAALAVLAKKLGALPFAGGSGGVGEA